MMALYTATCIWKAVHSMNGLPASTTPHGSHRLHRYIHEKEVKKILDYIYSLLAKMKEHYCVYIGTKDLDRLATFVSGYECALFDLLGIQSQFNSSFQTFCEYKYKTTNGKHWSKIIQGNRTSSKAFDAFWSDLYEFRECMKNPDFLAQAQKECLQREGLLR